MPVPATTFMAPAGVTFSTLLLLWSTKIMFPPASSHKPNAPLSEEDVAMPLLMSLPIDPVPAIVVIIPEELILRMRK